MAVFIIYIMGVSGSGKTTIGQQLAAATGIPFFDADDFHSATNKEKMKAGQPLNDEDRKDWLLGLNRLTKEEAKKKGAIVACSALKESYRDLLSEGIEDIVHWVFLRGDYQLISERMRKRKGHFMPESLLQSQFETLEMPGDAIVMDIINQPGEIVKSITDELSIRHGG